MDDSSSVSEQNDEEPGSAAGFLTPSSYLALAMHDNLFNQ